MDRNTKGITIAGLIVTDIIHMIDKYPEKSMLANVKSSSRAVGGCVPNTIIDIAKIDPEIPLYAMGKVGNDDNGHFVISELSKYGVDTSGIVLDDNCPTDTSHAMTEMGTGDRTFFCASACNGSFCVEDVDVDNLDCEIFHGGYLLLLESLDAEDEEYGTKMAKLLNKVSKKGIKTSIDLVSSQVGRFNEIVVPAIKQCDYVIINEVESGRVSGYDPRNADGTLNIENIKKTMEKFFELGVREKVIIHSSEAGFLMDKDGDFVVVPSLELPKGWIKGSTGAGDCYCAACLYGLTQDFDNRKLLEFASAAAATNLSEADSISGVKSRAEIEELSRTLPRQVL